MLGANLTPSKTNTKVFPLVPSKIKEDAAITFRLQRDVEMFIFPMSTSIRAVIAYKPGSCSVFARRGEQGLDESDALLFESLIFSPAMTMMSLAARRDHRFRGSLRYALIEFGAFRQIVVPWRDGHLGVFIEGDADTLRLAGEIAELIRCSA